MKLILCIGFMCLKQSEIAKMENQNSGYATQPNNNNKSATPSGAPNTGGGISVGPAVANVAVTAPSNDMSWVHTGERAVATSNAMNAESETRRQEARARGYFPNRFRLKATAGQFGQDHIGRIIILDEDLGPRYHEHDLPHPSREYHHIYEPCPKEFEECPLCPPSGEKGSYYVLLLSVLNLKGYTNKQGILVAPTKELLAIKVAGHAEFDELKQYYGSLRGLEIVMYRDGPRSAASGMIDKNVTVLRHSDADIEAMLRQTGNWKPKITQEGELLEPENWMSVPFDYSKFLHRPEAARLRQLYGGTAPLGASDFGAGGGYSSGSAPIPNGYQQQGGYGQTGAGAGGGTGYATQTSPYGMGSGGAVAQNGGYGAQTHQPAAQPAQPAAAQPAQPATAAQTHVTVRSRTQVGGPPPATNNGGAGGGWAAAAHEAARGPVELDDEIPF